jgi:hypothetical protein
VPDIAAFTVTRPIKIVQRKPVVKNKLRIFVKMALRGIENGSNRQTEYIT